jgi:hypothetical protein
MKATFYGFSGRMLAGLLQVIGSTFALLLPTDKKSKKYAIVNFQTTDSNTIVYPKTSISAVDQDNKLNELFDEEGKKFTLGVTVHGVTEILDYDLDAVDSNTPVEDLELRVRDLGIENGILYGEFLNTGYGLPIDYDEEFDQEEYPFWDEFECPVKYIDYIMVDELKDDDEEETAEDVAEEYEVFEC